MTSFLLSLTDYVHSQACDSSDLVAGIVPLASMVPTQDNYSDLLPLKTKLKNVRVVLLGEQQHGDGATFLAKTRLIKFLHSEMEFDVLAFESGLFESILAWEKIRQGEAVRHALRQSLPQLWSLSRQCQPLFECIDQNNASDRPLVVTGFDCNFTGSYGLLLRQQASAVLESRQLNVDHQAVLNLIDSLYVVGRVGIPSYQDVKISQQVSDSQIERLQDMNEDGQTILERTSFWAQIIKNLRSFALIRYDVKTGRGSLDSLRDAQMADNLNYICNHLYPTQKIIVWAANSHISNGLESVEDTQNYISYHPRRTMGQYLRLAWGTQMYSIGFTSYEGQSGLPWTAPRNLGRASEGTVEDCFNKTGFEQVFVDISGANSLQWLRHKRVSRILSHVEMNMDVSKMFDGIVFIKTMTPSMPIR